MRRYITFLLFTSAICLTGCDDSSTGTENGSSADVGLQTLNNPIAITRGQDNSTTVSGQANVFAAELTTLPEMPGGAGQLPPTFLFTANAGQILTLSTATGAADCCSAASPADPPDGGSGFSRTNLSSFQDLSGMVVPGTAMFISAVFTNGRNTEAQPPQGIDYTTLDVTTVAEFFPQLNQVFYVGDGMTVNGTTQSFFVPASATAVTFGVADGFGFNGSPGFYDDNTGEWQITFRLD